MKKSEQSTSFEFLRDIGLASIAPLFKKMKGVVVIPIITKWLGAGAFGLWKQFSITSGFTAALATMGTAQVIHRYLAPMERPEKYSAHFFAIELFVVCIALTFSIGLVLAPQFTSGRIFGADTSLLPLYLLAAYLPVLVFSNRLLTFLESRRRFDVIAPLVIVRDLVSMVVVIILILLGRSVVQAILAYVLWEVVAMLAAFELARRKAELRIVRPDFSRLTKYLSFGLPLIFVTLGSQLAQFADRYVIVNVLGIEEVGIYSVAYAGGAIGVLILKPIKQVILPDFSVLVESGMQEKIERRLNAVMKYYIAAQAGIFTFVWFLGYSALVLVSTESFIEGLSAMKVIPLGVMASGVLHIGTHVLSAEENTRVAGLLWVGVGILNTVSNLIAVPLLGLFGAGLATVLSYAAGAVACWKIVLRSYSIRLRPKTLIRIIAAIIITGGMLFLLVHAGQFSPLVTVSVGGSLGGGVYLATLIASGFISQDERKMLEYSLDPRISKFLTWANIL